MLHLIFSGNIWETNWKQRIETSLFRGIFVKIPLKQESHIKKKIPNNRLIIKDFFG